MSARSATSVSKPMSLANSSSSVGQHALLEVAHGDGERALLAAEVLARVLGRERVLGRRLVADVLADERLVDLRERLAGAELDLDALAAAVLDLLAVDREREVDREDVALLRGARGLGRLERRVALAETLELLLDQLLVDLDLRAAELEALELHVLDLGLHLEGRRERERLLRVDALRLDVRLAHRREVLVAQDLRQRVVDDRVRDVVLRPAARTCA